MAGVGDGWGSGGGRRLRPEDAGPSVRCGSLGVTSLQVLLQEPNPGIEFEFWLPRERYGPFQAQAQAQAQALGWSLRQQQPRQVEAQPPELPAAPATTVPRIPTPTPGEAGPAGGGEQAGRGGPCPLPFGPHRRLRTLPGHSRSCPPAAPLLRQ